MSITNYKHTLIQSTLKKKKAFSQPCLNHLIIRHNIHPVKMKTNNIWLIHIQSYPLNQNLTENILDPHLFCC